MERKDKRHSDHVDLTIVVPVYNELDEAIEKTVKRERTVKRLREWTVVGVIFETLQVSFQSNIFCFAKGFKLGLVADEIFGAI